MKNLVISLFMVMIGSLVFAKRVSPPVIGALANEAAQYEFSIKHIKCENADELCAMKVTLVAKALKDQKVLWETPLYRRIFRQGMEVDVQEIYPRTLSLKADLLQATDEREQLYFVNWKTGTLVAPAKEIMYTR